MNYLIAKDLEQFNSLNTITQYEDYIYSTLHGSSALPHHYPQFFVCLYQNNITLFIVISHIQIPCLSTFETNPPAPLPVSIIRLVSLLCFIYKDASYISVAVQKAKSMSYWWQCKNNMSGFSS